MKQNIKSTRKVFNTTGDRGHIRYSSPHPKDASFSAIHRDDGPAYITPNGAIEYAKNSKFTLEIKSNGEIECFSNGKTTRGLK